MKQDRIIERVDKMVASGRITEEEAERLRATEGTADFDAAVGQIRVRHARAHMDKAIAEGEMTQEEGDGYVERLRGGEHPEGLRARLGKHRPRRQSGSQIPTDSAFPEE
jgi:polyhydroxyalkanoate synthesis regulator phasin